MRRDAAGRDAVRGDVTLFAVCVGLALVALALPRTWTTALTATIRRTALRPAVMLQARAAEDRSARFRLERIQASRDSMSLVLQEDALMRRENDQLRSLINLRARLPRPFVAGEVIHRPLPSDPRTLLVGIGTGQGLAQFDPVVTADGLLGYVWSAGPASSAILTWAHPEFRASSVTGDGRVLGMLAPISAGEGGATLLALRGVALRDSLPLGATVFTSGLGGVYPRGIPVGRVISVARDSLGYERIYRVAPFVNPGDAMHVLVLTTPRDSTFLPMPGDSIP